MTAFGHDKSDRLGARFWLLMFGTILAVGIGGMIFFLLFGAAWVAFGFLGAILTAFLAVTAGVWLFQRYTQRNR